VANGRLFILSILILRQHSSSSYSLTMSPALMYYPISLLEIYLNLRPPFFFYGIYFIYTICSTLNSSELANSTSFFLVLSKMTRLICKSHSLESSMHFLIRFLDLLHLEFLSLITSVIFLI